MLVWVSCCPSSSLWVKPGFTDVVDLSGDLKGMKLEWTDIFDIYMIISGYVDTRGPHLFYKYLGEKKPDLRSILLEPDRTQKCSAGNLIYFIWLWYNSEKIW